MLQRKIQYQAVLVPVFWNMADVLQPLSDGGMGNFFPTQGNRAARALFQPGEPIDQLTLSIAVNSRQADDFPGPNRKADPLHRVFLMQLGGDPKFFYLENHLPRFRLRLIDLQLNWTSHHHVGQRLFVGVLGLHRTNVLPLTQNRNPVRHRHNLIQFMGNKQNGLSLCS